VRACRVQSNLVDVRVSATLLAVAHTARGRAVEAHELEVGGALAIRNPAWAIRLLVLSAQGMRSSK
jgi:hypothetical protein